MKPVFTFIEYVDQEAGQQRHQGAVSLQVKQEQRDEVIGQAEGRHQYRTWD